MNFPPHFLVLLFKTAFHLNASTKFALLGLNLFIFLKASISSLILLGFSDFWLSYRLENPVAIYPSMTILLYLFTFSTDHPSVPPFLQPINQSSTQFSAILIILVLAMVPCLGRWSTWRIEGHPDPGNPRCMFSEDSIRLCLKSNKTKLAMSNKQGKLKLLCTIIFSSQKVH